VPIIEAPATRRRYRAGRKPSAHSRVI
jgi:hypothetical protein